MTFTEGQKKLARVATFVVAVSAIALPVGLAGGDAYVRVDSDWYLRIAQGNTRATMHPFAARQLGPLIVRGLAALTHIALLHCFLILGIASLLTAAAICGWLLVARGARWPELLAVGGTFFWSATFGAFMLPDTLGAALLAIFLLLLWQRRYTLAACLLLPMFVSRESTVLVLICLLAAGWRSLPGLQRALSVVASAGGIVLVRLLTTKSLPNREQINPVLYMAGKMPWNFSSNLLARALWMPTFNSFCATPSSTLHLPWGMHLGSAYEVGLCGWQPSWQPRLILIALCSFGLLPVVTLFLWRYHRGLLWGRDLYLRFCVAYGAVSFLIAPLLGRSMERLFLYGWPLFLLITPLAAARALRGKAVPWKLLFALHLATAWADWLLFAWWDQASVLRAWSFCALVVAINVLAWELLRRADAEAPVPLLQPAIAIE